MGDSYAAQATAMRELSGPVAGLGAPLARHAAAIQVSGHGCFQLPQPVLAVF